MAGWRYFATRLNGDGTEDLLEPALPFTDVQVGGALSSVPTFDATLPVKAPRFTRELFTPWSTAIYAELGDTIRGAGIVVDATVETDGSLKLEADGWLGYLKDLPFDAVRQYTGGDDSDPLQIARDIWEHVQGFAGGDIGLRLDIDPATSDIRLGHPEEDVSFTTKDDEDVDFDAGPYTLAWWETQDLQQAWEDLAEQGGFDYWEEHTWANRAHTRIKHVLHINYPASGRRRTDLRFKVGERDLAMPTVEWSGDEYASEVIVLGSGEGKDMVRANWPRTGTGRLRRVKTISEKGLQTRKQAKTKARLEAARLTGKDNISEVVLPMNGWNLGDTITLLGDGTGWAGDTRMPVRITEYAISPDESDQATVQVERAERTSNG